MTTLIFAVILFFFLWQGYKAGFIRSLARLLSWVVAYPAAYFLTMPLVKIILSYTSLQGLVVYFIAGALIFFAVSFLATQLLNIYFRYNDPIEKTNISKINGALLGGVVGGIVGLLVAYAVTLVKIPNVQHVKPLSASSASTTSATQAIQTQPVIIAIPSLVDKAASQLVSHVAKMALESNNADVNTVRLVETVTQHPAEMMQHIASLTGRGEVNIFFLDKDAQAALDSGDVNKVVESTAFQELIANPDMRAILIASVDTRSAQSPQHYLAEKIVDVWQKKTLIAENPQVLAILADKQVQQQMADPNKMSLLMNPKMMQLVDIIFDKNISATAIKPSSSLAQPTKDSNNTDIKTIPSASTSNASQPHFSSVNIKAFDTPIYQWKDEKGAIHYSDKPKDRQ